MIQQKHNSYRMWRKVMLSATFLCLIFFTFSCRKDRSTIGEGALPPGTTLSSDGVDTFSLKTYSIEVDTVNTTHPQFNLVGKYNDPETGVFEASFFSQLAVSAFSPDFGDIDGLTVDSVVLAFRFGGFYGYPQEQNFKVYELSEDLEGEDYYSHSEVQFIEQNLISNEGNGGTIKPDPENTVVVGGDQEPPQLRLPLKNEFGKRLLEIASETTSDEDFLSAFKGFHVKVDDPTPQTGAGAVYYLSSNVPESKLSVYYKMEEDSIQESFNFLIQSDLVDFNNVKLDRTGSNLEQVLQDTSRGQETYFAQAFNVRARIEFPTVSEINKDAVIHEATLELPVSYFSESNFFPSAEVIVLTELIEGSSQLFSITQSPIRYNQQRRAYIIDIKEYIQRIITGQYINRGVWITPNLFNTSADRIVFNGVETSNKSKPRLNIVFTEF